MFDLSMVIPAFNEEKCIKDTLETLMKYLSINQINSEIVVVDDGSSDFTTEIINQLNNHQNEYTKVCLVKNERNYGKGYALKRGMLTACGKIRIFMDADLPFELEVIKEIMAKIISGYHVVIGSRDLPGSTLVDVTFFRYIAGRVFSWLVHILAFSGYPDTQCGLKGFSADSAEKIFSRATINDFGIDVELLFIARKLNYSILKIPVRMTGNRSDSRVNLIRDSVKMLMELFIIRWNDIFHRYDA